MAKKQFKTESKRILDLMINSIYTNKEIFLRELISNASDAIDKLYFKSLTDHNVGLSRSDFEIFIKLDKENRTITITDNGIGMSKEELELNLGTIARSGSGEFVKNNELNEEIDIIGQFGVGFYSAFMVADKVSVTSLCYGGEDAFKWVAEDGDGYTITSAKKETVGTEIVLHIKDDSEKENYSEFLDSYKITSIIKKYSDYIRYPIKMEVEHFRKKADAPEDSYETESYTEIDTINSMTPLWKKAKKDVTQEEYTSFYKDKFRDFSDPLKTIHQKAEGTTEFQALLYIPAKADYNYYSKDFERGLQLYSSGVMIMERCTDLLPEYFGFVKGLVDSEDLSLNISREMLQQDRQLSLIKSAVEKKVQSELYDMLKSDRESYEKFWQAFGLTIKFGIYQSYGTNKEQLQDLLMFKRSSDGKLITLKEYREAMTEEQKYIYFAAGDDFEKLSKLPQAEMLKDKGFEMLCLTDNVDEFLMQILAKYDEKELRSVSSGDLGLETEEEKKEQEQKATENKSMLDFMKDSLNAKVFEVAISSRLKSHPVCLTSKGAISLEMEKVLNEMPGDNKVQAQKVLEINANHEIFNTLSSLFESDKEKLADYTTLLYNQALLMEGLSVEDPIAFSNAICKLMK